MRGKKILSIIMCLAMMLSFVSVRAEDREYSILDSEVVRLLGRGEVKPGNARTFNWPNAGFEFEFSGSKAEVLVDVSAFDTTASEGNFFNVAVYSGENLIRVDRIKLVLGWNTIYEAQTGDPEIKKIMIVRSSEACRGTLTISKLRCDDVPKATAPRERLIEFIGDSYTAGYGNSPELSATTYYCAQNTDNWNSYTGMVSRHFGADNNVIAYQGKGVYANQSGETYNNTMSQQFLNQEINVDSNMSINRFEGKEHNFSKYQPQVVSIWLGTNDWAKKVDVETFKTAYAQFLDTVRSKYPDAHILNLVLENSSYLGAIKSVVEDSSRGEDNKYHMLVLNKFTSVSLGHPDIAEDERIAKQVIDKINSIPFVWSGKRADTEDSKFLSVRANYNTGKVNIFGHIDAENDQVVTMVMKPGTTLSDIEEKSNIVYVSQGETDSAGEYSFDFTTDKLPGEYVIYINSISTDNLTEKEFTFKNFIPTLTVTKDGEKIKSLESVGKDDELLVTLSGFDVNEGIAGMLAVAEYKNETLLNVSIEDASEDSQTLGTEVTHEFSVSEDADKVKVFYVNVNTLTPFIGAYEIN